MKKHFYLMLGMILSASVASAEMIQGTIAFVDPTSHMISVRRFDKARSGPAQFLVKIKDDTKTRNVASASELQVGQEVKVDARQNRTEKILEADTIEVTGDLSS